VRRDRQRRTRRSSPGRLSALRPDVRGRHRSRVATAVSPGRWVVAAGLAYAPRAVSRGPVACAFVAAVSGPLAIRGCVPAASRFMPAGIAGRVAGRRARVRAGAIARSARRSVVTLWIVASWRGRRSGVSRAVVVCARTTVLRRPPTNTARTARRASGRVRRRGHATRRGAPGRCGRSSRGCAWSVSRSRGSVSA
jgi:hypothetical protein